VGIWVIAWLQKRVQSVSYSHIRPLSWLYAVMCLKGRQTKHLLWAPISGPLSMYSARQYSSLLVKSLLSAHIIFSEPHHNSVLCVQSGLQELLQRVYRFDLANHRVCSSHSSSTISMLDCSYSTRHKRSLIFAVVNCFDAMMSVFYSPVLMGSLIFLRVVNTYVVTSSLYPSDILTWSTDGLFSMP